MLSLFIMKIRGLHPVFLRTHCSVHAKGLPSFLTSFLSVTCSPFHLAATTGIRRESWLGGCAVVSNWCLGLRKRIPACKGAFFISKLTTSSFYLVTFYMLIWGWSSQYNRIGAVIYLSLCNEKLQFPVLCNLYCSSFHGIFCFVSL